MIEWRGLHLKVSEAQGGDFGGRNLPTRLKVRHAAFFFIPIAFPRDIVLEEWTARFSLRR